MNKIVMNNIISKAKHIAIEAHKGQTRWDGKTPYITHPKRVAIKVVEKVPNPKFHNLFIATALLHNVIEDTKISLNDLIEKQIPPIIIGALIAITNIFDESYLNYILRVKENFIATTVKICDIEDNLEDLEKDPKRNKQRIEKYKLAKYILEQE